MRTELVVFRVRRHLTQEQLADRLGYARGTVQAIEAGKRAGRRHFWKTLQRLYGLTTNQIERMQTNDKY